MPGKAVDPKVRIDRLSIPEPNTGCWFWLGSTDKRGYGEIGYKGKVKRAHRVSYEVYKGPVPRGLQLDHKCRNTCCVNPDHLEPVTQAENMRRRRRTHCSKGHHLVGDNRMEIRRKPSEGRYHQEYDVRCRMCVNERLRNWRRRTGRMRSH